MNRNKSLFKTLNYYEWREFEARIGDRSIRYASKPGLPAWERADIDARLLAEASDVGTAERLLDMRSGKGIVATYAALCGADVSTLDDSIVAVEATKRTLQLNDVSNVLALDRNYDVVTLALPKSRDVWRHAIRNAARVLKAGGRMYLAGANRAGIKSAIGDLASIFGRASVQAYKKGHRVAVATRPDTLDVDAEAEDDFANIEVEARGEQWKIVSAPGVFARDRLDEGTRRLIETMTLNAGESMLDLGCGCGIVGLVGARMGCQVTCVDASAQAVEATRRTMSINGHDADAVEVLWSDCASAVRERKFDVVVTNPPFHQGVGVDAIVARQFIHDAARVLRPGGRLYLVANRFLRYEREMRERGPFDPVRVVYEDKRFCVFEAVKPS